MISKVYRYGILLHLIPFPLQRNIVPFQRVREAQSGLNCGCNAASFSAPSCKPVAGPPKKCF